MLLKNGVESNGTVIRQVADILEIKQVGNIDRMVMKLREHFSEKLKDIHQDDWIVCDVCGEVTDDDSRITVCPFCGDEGEEYEDAEVLDGEEIDSPEEPVEPKVVDLTKDEDPIETVEEEIVSKVVVADGVVVRKGKAKEKGKDIKSLVPAKKRGKPVVSENNDNYHEISYEKKSQMLLELSKEKDIIEKEKENMVGSGYDLGCSLRRIYRGEFWKAEGHKSWRSFIETIGISHTLAYNLMKMVVEFDRKTFMKVGSTKLHIVAKADKKDRKELLDAAKSGASVRDLSKQLNEKKGELDESKNELKKEEKKEKDKGKNDHKIVLLAKVGGKPTSYMFKNRDSHVELDKWEKDAYVEIPISDSVIQYVVLKTDKDNNPIGLTIVFRAV
jgi:rubrerythrin